MGKKLSKSNVLWYIRSRPYTSLPDLRRRFEINGDEMSLIEGPGGRVWIGLPERAAQIIAQLWREGKIGLERSVAVRAPVIEGVYPMHLRMTPSQPPHQDVASPPADADVADEVTEEPAETDLEMPTDDRA